MVGRLDNKCFEFPLSKNKLPQNLNKKLTSTYLSMKMNKCIYFSENKFKVTKVTKILIMFT